MEFVEVIEIVKSMKERHEEYTHIYKIYGSEEDNPYSMWSSYFTQMSTTVELAGWRALWKLSKSSSFQYDLHFSSAFLVMVKQLNYSTLSADIELINDEDRERFNLTRELSVPLTELHITKEQENDNTPTIVIAQYLDQLRLFCKYLWWPWDADGHSLADWFSKNLLYRLKLYEDISVGNYSESITRAIKTLIEKGKFFYNVYLQETETVSEDREPNSETKRKIVEHLRNIELIKTSLESFTNYSRESLSFCHGMKQCNVDSGGGFIVVRELNLTQIIHCIREISKSHPTTKLRKVSSDLENILCRYETDDTIFLSPEEHRLNGECLNTNVTIQSSTKERSIIYGESYFWYLLKTTSDNINLRNLTIHSRENVAIVYVKEGITCMDSITMISSTERQKGIIVGEKATLIANGCEFNNFSTAIICLPGSAVQLTDCIFQKNVVAIEVVGHAQLCLNNVTATQSGKAFIRYEGDIPLNEFKSLEELSNVADVSLESVKIDHDEESAVHFV